MPDADYVRIGEKSRNCFPRLKAEDVKVLWFFSENPDASTYALYNKGGPLLGRRNPAYLAVKRLEKDGYLRFRGSRPSKKNPGIDANEYELTVKGRLAAIGAWSVDPRALKTAPGSRWIQREGFTAKGIDVRKPEQILSLFDWRLSTYDKFGVKLDDMRFETLQQLAFFDALAFSLDPEGAERAVGRLGFKPVAEWRQRAKQAHAFLSATFPKLFAQSENSGHPA